MSDSRWVQDPLFEEPRDPQPACWACGDTRTVPQARNGQPMVCPWCDPRWPRWNPSIAWHE